MYINETYLNNSLALCNYKVVLIGNDAELCCEKLTIIIKNMIKIK